MTSAVNVEGNKLIEVLRSCFKKRLVIPAFFYVALLLGCDNHAPASVISFSGPTMGTIYNIKVVDNGSGYSVSDLQSLVDSELRSINQTFSTYIPDSELSLFNQAEVGVALPISSQLCHLLSINSDISSITKGRYDVTVGPLVNLWGFGPEHRHGIPTTDALMRAKARVDYTALDFDCSAKVISKAKDVYVDLSASAKGYATDKVAALLISKGYHQAMIEIGGELHLVGENASGESWRIAVEKPTLGHTGSVQVLQVSDVAVATSGDYRNYYEVDGVRFSHTIDPKTASPITHKLASVTVIMRGGASADAWATALNVLGPDEGLALAEAQGIAAYFLVVTGDSYSVKYTPAFQQYMVNI